MSAALATELKILEKRALIVDLAKTGKSYRAIAAEVGYKSPASVAEQIAAWAAETRPSSEATEELRKLQSEQIDALFLALWPRREEEVVVDRLVKLMDRKARLFGLDLQPGVTIGVFTAEAMASAFGWDHEVEAVEEAAPAQITEGT